MSKCVILLLICIAVSLAYVQEEILSRCSEPIFGGYCRAYKPRYGYNATTKTCQQFIYGGCGGTSNRFDTQLECEEACIVH